MTKQKEQTKQTKLEKLRKQGMLVQVFSVLLGVALCGNSRAAAQTAHSMQEAAVPMAVSVREMEAVGVSMDTDEAVPADDGESSNSANSDLEDTDEDGWDDGDFEEIDLDNNAGDEEEEDDDDMAEIDLESDDSSAGQDSSSKKTSANSGSARVNGNKTSSQGKSTVSRSTGSSSSGERKLDSSYQTGVGIGKDWFLIGGAFAALLAVLGICLSKRKRS